MKEQRKKAAHRKRRIIFNNDGSEWDYAREPTAQDVLRLHTIGLEDSHVDTVFFSSCAMGCNMYCHDTKVGEVFQDQSGIIRGLIEKGTDMFQVMIDHWHGLGKEIFWSCRVNDEHDSWIPGATSKWKRDHPEYLMGTRENPPPYGPWSALDYGMPEVREQYFRTLEEICTRYDVDGIELDFFRQLLCFRKHVWGDPLGEHELKIMNDHMARIRAMTEKVGRERGRPILIAARVPDCPAFAKQLAFDVEAWLANDLIDIMVVGGYFWLRKWEQSAELGHKYDVPVYASLDASRMADDETRQIRRSDDAYRAHAAMAWRAGVDGIYVFNFNYMRGPCNRIWSELGDPRALAGLDKIYHVSVMGDGHPHVEYYLRGGRKYIQLPRLCPDHPLEMTEGQVHVTTLSIADDPAAAGQRFTPKATLNVQVTGLAHSGELAVSLGGQTLGPTSLTWPFENKDHWLEYDVEPHAVRNGDNRLEITLARNAQGCTLHDVHLRLEHGPNSDRRRDMVMSRNRFLAYDASTV